MPDAEAEPRGRHRTRSTGAIVFDLIMLAFVTLIVVTALDIRPGARLVPLSIGLPTMALLLLQLAVDVRGRVPVEPHRGGLASTDLSRASIGEVVEAARDEEVDELAADKREDVPRQVLFAAWTVAYIGLGVATNFLIATPIAVGALFLIARVQPLLAFVLAAATGLGVWLVFDLFLQVRF